MIALLLRFRAYALRVATAIDVLLMTVLSGRRNETISACLWSMDESGRMIGYALRPVVDAIFLLFGDKNHCQVSWENENREVA